MVIGKCKYVFSVYFIYKRCDIMYIVFILLVVIIIRFRDFFILAFKRFFVFKNSCTIVYYMEGLGFVINFFNMRNILCMEKYIRI